MSTLERTTCCTCGIKFAVPEHFLDDCRRKGREKSFFCPNGHSLSFKESETDKMRRERDIARQQVARAEQETWEANESLRKAERREKNLKRKLAAGACPCCQRSFANMAEHVRKQHPEYVADNVVKLGKPA